MEQKATVQITQAMILGCKHPKDIADLPAVADNWIRTYNRCNRRTDGDTKYEREKIMFIQSVSASTALSKTNPFSQYVALMRLAVCGISLEDGEASLIPRSKNCTLHIEAKGRRTMISNLPGVLHVGEPQVVYDCDCDPQQTDAPYRPTQNMYGLVINDWRAAFIRPEYALIQHVYVIVHFKHGPKAYSMDRDDVLQIRDEFSDSYKSYIKDLADNAASQTTQNRWPAMKAIRRGNDGSTYFADIKPPMWVNREAEAWKKTMIHRLWKSMDKPAHQQYLDDRFAAEAAADGIVVAGFGDDPADLFEFNQDFANGAAKAPKAKAPKNTPPIPEPPVQQEAAPAPPEPVVTAPAVAPPPPPEQYWNPEKGAWDQKSTAEKAPDPVPPPAPDASGFDDIGDPNTPF